eukprot:2243913-Amphidinium_carterae.1
MCPLCLKKNHLETLGRHSPLFPTETWVPYTKLGFIKTLDALGTLISAQPTNGRGTPKTLRGVVYLFAGEVLLWLASWGRAPSIFTIWRVTQDSIHRYMQGAEVV